MKLVSEHINEFKQGQDPYKTMGMGYTGRVNDWADQINNFYIQDGGYERPLTSKTMRFNKNSVEIFHPININGSNINWLPDNMTIHGFLDIENTNITKLPINLKILTSARYYGSLFTNLSTSDAIGLVVQDQICIR
jgi:hypothetical protein